MIFPVLSLACLRAVGGYFALGALFDLGGHGETQFTLHSIFINLFKMSYSLSPLRYMSIKQNRRTENICPIVFPEAYKGPLVKTGPKSVAEKARHDYHMARLKDHEIVHISFKHQGSAKLIFL